MCLTDSPWYPLFSHVLYFLSTGRHARSGFLNLSTVGMGWGAVLWIVRCVAVSLASTYLMPVAPHQMWLDDSLCFTSRWTKCHIVLLLVTLNAVTWFGPGLPSFSNIIFTWKLVSDLWGNSLTSSQYPVFQNLLSNDFGTYWWYLFELILIIIMGGCKSSNSTIPLHF